MLFLYTSNYPYTLKQGAWIRPSVFSIQLFSFFYPPTWIKGLKTRKKGIGNFVMYFLLLYYIIYIIYIDI